MTEVTDEINIIEGYTTEIKTYTIEYDDKEYFIEYSEGGKYAEIKTILTDFKGKPITDKALKKKLLDAFERYQEYGYEEE